MLVWLRCTMACAPLFWSAIANAQQFQGTLGLAGTSASDVRGTTWSAGAGAAGALRAPLGGPLSFTLDARAGLTTTSYDLSYASTTVIPALELRRGWWAVYAGAHAEGAISRWRNAAVSAPALFGPALQRHDSSSTRTYLGALFGGSAQYAGPAGALTVVGYRESHGTIDTVATVDREFSVQLQEGRLTVGATFDARRERQTSSAFGGAYLSVDIARSAALQVGAGTYGEDRLIGTPAGHYMSLGMSFRTRSFGASAPDGRATPSPLGNGMTRVRVRDARASRVEIAGDFTNWQPVAAQRGDGAGWYLDLRIPPGQYRYAYRENGGAWRAPDGAPTTKDDFGGVSAWLIVSAPPSSTR